MGMSSVGRAGAHAGVKGSTASMPGGDFWMGCLSLGGDPIHDCPGAGGRERVTLDNESGD